MILPLVVFTVLLLGAATPYIVRSEKHLSRLSLLWSVCAGFGMSAIALSVFQSGGAVLFGQWFSAGSFGAVMMLLVSVVSVSASIVSIRYIGHERTEDILNEQQARLYFSCFHLFVLSMFLALIADNTMLLWIALEGTTLSTTLLVALYKKDASIEAAWKYVLLCSTGIGLGLIGVLMTTHAAIIGTGASTMEAFSLRYLVAHAAEFNPDIMRWAFVFIFVGFGTKAGLVPMHAWLPDAHSKTPSPISAMLSGLLLNVALFTILRYKLIVDSTFGNSGWTNTFFLVFGLVSVALPAIILLVQRNYKRMLAYSSIEHMGLMTFGFGLGSIGTIAATMHMVGHAFTKSALFFAAGEILLRTKTTKLELIRGLSSSLPITSVLFLAGILGILGAPSSALFASEFQLLRGGFGLFPLGTIGIAAFLTLVAFSMMRHSIALIFGEPTETVKREKKQETWNITHTVIAIHLAALVFFGMWFLTSSGYEAMRSVAESIQFAL